MADLGMTGIHAGSDSHEGQEGLKTDEDMAREIGDKRMYMPQYVTAIVGHGTKAPGYLAAIGCVGTGMFVWREWRFFFFGPKPRANWGNCVCRLRHVCLA